MKPHVNGLLLAASVMDDIKQGLKYDSIINFVSLIVKSESI
jgi:hypothetical protein